MTAFDKRKLVLDQLKWLAVYMGIAFVIAILLPFPIDWLVTIPVFLLITLYRRKLFFRKLNMHFKEKSTSANLKGFREFFKLVSHNPLSQSDDSYRRVKYFCIKTLPIKIFSVSNILKLNLFNYA